MSSQISILVVDDEIRVVRALGRLFKSHYTVHLAEGGQQALDIIKNNPIHIVVSDQRMPLMTGSELLSKIKIISPNTIRILLTGYSDLVAVMDSVNQGEIYRYITKPWDNQELLKVVQQAGQVAASLFLNSMNSYETDSQEPCKLLILDRDDKLSKPVQQLIRKRALCLSSRDVEMASDLIQEYDISILLVNLKKDHNDEEYAFIKMLKAIRPQLLCIVIAEEADSIRIVKLINEGQIYRYLSKPLKLGMLKLNLMSAVRYHHKLEANPHLLDRHKVEEISIPKEREIVRKHSSLWQKFKHFFG